jgi:hypothetical protein
VNPSAAEVGEVPFGVVTVTSTVPVPAGEVAVIEVSELTVKLAAEATPKRTAVAPVKPVPVMVTVVPPASGPAIGVTALTVGTEVYLNWSAAETAEVPPAVVTVTSTVPDPAGAVAVIDVSEPTVYVAVVVPNLTAVAPVKPDPVIDTLVPPPSGPLVGAMEVTVGPEVYVKPSATDVAEVPFGVVTVTSTLPLPAGETAVIDVSEPTE